ncbi:hypothetical protein IT087_04145, partial [Candidatus Uhrbacteria bacterium]|nr:hypothetical protein [Candidatus Uhrbacteria bacterium]
MPEKFGSNPFESFNARADREAKEEKAFWDKEVAAWRARQTASPADTERAKSAPRSEAERRVYNNLSQWLPPAADSVAGSHRTQDFGMHYADGSDPEYAAASERLVHDIDAYLEANNLMGFVDALRKQQYRRSSETFKGGKFIPAEKLITGGEIHEFFKDLYYAMRKRGHSHE